MPKAAPPSRALEEAWKISCYDSAASAGSVVGAVCKSMRRYQLIVTLGREACLEGRMGDAKLFQ